MQSSLQRLERVIIQKNSKIQQLTRHIEQLHAPDNRLQDESENNSSIAGNYGSARIQLLENKIAGLTAQNIHYQVTCSQRSETIHQLHSKLSQLARELGIARIQMNLMKIDCQSVDTDTLKALQGQIQKCHQQISSLIHEKTDAIMHSKKLEHELGQAQDSFKAISDAFRQHIREFDKLLQKLSLKEKDLQDPGFPSANTEEIQRLSQLTEVLQGQLNKKNVEIVELYDSIASNKDVCLERTLHFLRENLCKKSVLVRQTLAKLRTTDRLIKQLQEGLARAEGMPQKVCQMTEELNRSKHENLQLRRAIAQLQGELSSMKRERNQSNSQLVALLTENQSYHDMMFSEFGQAHYLGKIQEHRMRMESNISMRKKDRKWVTISELIDLNRTLMNLVDS